MPGLGPGIHDFSAAQQMKIVDGRDKPGHDWLVGLVPWFRGLSVRELRVTGNAV
jgi:hypothetical protein